MKKFNEYKELEDFLINFRRDMHLYPELSNEEFITTEKIKKVLTQHDIKILDLPLVTGLIAEIGTDSENVVVLRADIDALPIVEETEGDIVSKIPGVMHACGHDFHTSAVLGAAILLKNNEENLNGKVRIIFQAAEETGLGAIEFIKEGALIDAKAIFGFHNDPTLPVGTMGSKHGALTAGVDRFFITVKAKGVHAAKPHDGNDPIIILGQLISSLQTIISRNIESKQNAVVSITQIHSGSTWNVIPESGFVEGTVRTFDQSIRELVEKRFREIVSGTAITYGAEIDLNWQSGPPSVFNDGGLTDYAMQIGKEEGFEVKVVESSPIGEDFSFYQQVVPGAFMMIGSGGPYALHHPKFRVDDKILFRTSHYLYRVISKFLIN